MAKMNKKFVATSLTAAMVATAIAPVAGAAFTDSIPNYAKDAVSYVSEKGIMNGLGGTTEFGAAKNITRAEVAVLLAKAAGLTTTGKTANFADVPAGHWASGAIAAIVEAGIAEGTGTGFNPTGEITRQEAAKMFANAFKLKLNEKTTVNYTDLNSVATWASKEVEILSSLGVFGGKDGGKFAPTDKITRGEVATLVHRSLVEDVRLKAEATAVKAVNSSTIEISGANLNMLVADNISLDNNEVASIKVAADGKTATVAFKHHFTAEKENEIKVNGKALKFTFTLSAIKTVELETATYDDDTASQLLKFKVNGETMTTDSEFLRQSGYSVNFIAVDSDNTAADIFYGATATSTTGLLAPSIEVGKYTVEIQIIKGGEIVVSDKSVVTITDVESKTEALNSLRFNNSGLFNMKSTTLVLGETAELNRVVGNAEGKKDVLLSLDKVIIESTNPEVISVDSSTLTLTANGVGTTKITVTIGTVSKTVEFTVSNKSRVVTKVTPNESVVKLVKGVTRTIEVTTLDQYGDPIEVVAGNPATGSTALNEDVPQNAAGVALVTVDDLETLVTSGKTTAGYEITADQVGNGTLLFKNLSGAVLGKVSVQVTDVVTTGSTKVEYTVASDNTSNSIAKDDVNEYQIAKYTNAGFFNGLLPLSASAGATGEYYVYSADSTVADVVVDPATDTFTVTGLKSGKTDIHVTDENGLTVHKFTVTVDAGNAAKITKVNFKAAKTIDYKGEAIDVTDVLDVRSAIGTDDRIVYGIEHNVNTTAKVRLDETDTLLYIDTDNDGDLTAADTILGQVQAEILTGAKGTMNALIGAIGITPGSATYTTDLTDEGSILFRVVAPRTVSGTTTYPVLNTVSTTVIKVKVK